ncbi:hypothetical protein TNCT_396151 [Trichonephila clavata]|uniref:Uncharacterized protein n=1 Tax=Trichonephila clavata TaxID=2740835 RepID=A0A8X6FUX1_TRICU|nr:hypothetical protein TNCT_396151 [Trichonephila clavata]
MGIDEGMKPDTSGLEQMEKKSNGLKLQKTRAAQRRKSVEPLYTHVGKGACRRKGSSRNDSKTEYLRSCQCHKVLFSTIVEGFYVDFCIQKYRAMKISYEDFIFSYEGKRAFRQPPSRPDGRVVGVTYPKCIRKQGRWVKNSAVTPSTAR